MFYPSPNPSREVLCGYQNHQYPLGRFKWCSTIKINTKRPSRYEVVTTRFFRSSSVLLLVDERENLMRFLSIVAWMKKLIKKDIDWCLWPVMPRRESCGISLKEDLKKQPSMDSKMWCPKAKENASKPIWLSCGSLWLKPKNTFSLKPNEFMIDSILSSISNPSMGSERASRCIEKSRNQRRTTTSLWQDAPSHLKVGVAHQARSVFKSFFNGHDMVQACHDLTCWIQHVMDTGIQAIIRVAKRFQKFLDGVWHVIIDEPSNAKIREVITVAKRHSKLGLSQSSYFVLLWPLRSLSAQMMVEPIFFF